MAQKIEKAIVAGGQGDGNAADLDASGFLRACITRIYLQGRHAAQLGRRCSFLAAVKSQSKPAATLQWQVASPLRDTLGRKETSCFALTAHKPASSASGGYCGSGPGMESPRSTKPLDWEATRRCRKKRPSRSASRISPDWTFCGTGLNLDGIARPKSGQHAFPLNAQAHAGMGTVAAAQYVRH